ncbi:uncharacterized protein [Dysidea avara]|uniref:uncharacterized protein isoform X2 n=1 Tax=Dysidea avara TaxID=196820 RepID=UPI00331E3BF8
MADADIVQRLVLKEVTVAKCKEHGGEGAYGRVYAVSYCETIWAAKEIHSILFEHRSETEKGVYYPEVDGTKGVQLPVMVMEMMADSLSSFVEKYQNIPAHIKFSIIHDVSLGLCYLHNHNPPIVHCNLHPNNVLLTEHHRAKISDLGMAKVINTDSRKAGTKDSRVDFMPPESLNELSNYSTPMDVFIFAGIVLHTFNQQWPTPLDKMQTDNGSVTLSEVERRQQYLDKLSGEGEVLRPLVEECLDDDPAKRPTIATVCRRIQSSKDTCSTQSTMNMITLHQKVEQLSSEMKQQQNKILQLQTTIKEMEKHTKSMPTQSQASKQDIGITESPESKLTPVAPPLTTALASGRYQMKWTRLADLPVPMYDAYVVVQDKKVYVTGISPNDEALHQVYVYNINTDHWDQLPVSGHYFGIPQIIGGRLAIIGGRLSATKERTNKVLTYDVASQTWISYYPDMLSVRSKPGVVTHGEHVIVAGGTRGDDIALVQDDIEILNWPENTGWRRVSTTLPVPMYDISCTISDSHLVIMSYYSIDLKNYTVVYTIPVSEIVSPTRNRLLSWIVPNKWSQLTTANRWAVALVPNSSPLMVLGGTDRTSTVQTTDISIFDNTSKSWKKIESSLTSARSTAAVAAVNNNAIIVIGGCTSRVSTASAKSSSMTIVELGQAELLQ